MNLTKRVLLSTAGILAVVSMIGVGQGQGQSLAADAAADAAVRAYWTPQRLMSARTMELRSSRPLSATATAITPETGPAQGAPEGHAAGKADAAMAQRLYTPNAAQPQLGDQPAQTSSVGAFFTTHRVFPTAAAQTVPALRAGKLFFTVPGSGPGTGNFVCSAEVGRHRLLFTAGHCVYSPNLVPKRFHTNFLFVPGLANGVGPTGSWTARTQQAAPAWKASTGGVPNAQDLAIIEVRDRVISLVTRKISFFTGFNGWRTSTFGPNHVTVLGYPCNLDSCNLMQRTDAGIFDNGGSNTFRFGSAARGGQSGGPILENFGVPGVGAPSPGGFGFNVSLSNVSYGPIATEPKYLGASMRNSQFVTMLNQMCALRPGNCTTAP